MRRWQSTTRLAEPAARDSPSQSTYHPYILQNLLHVELSGTRVMTEQMWPARSILQARNGLA